jgi:hypothetical protein
MDSHDDHQLWTSNKAAATTTTTTNEPTKRNWHPIAPTPISTTTRWILEMKQSSEKRCKTISS